MINKKILRRVSVFLLFMFAWSSTSFAQNTTIPQIAQNKALLEKYQLVEMTNKLGPSLGKNKMDYSSFNSLEEQEMGAPERTKQVEILSDLEEYYAKTIPSAEAETFNFKPLRQFGYDIFQQPGMEFSNASDQVINPDYMLGPGDNFTVTMWGIAEGVFNVQVDPEGNIILPKVGVVPVAGVRYGELKSYIEGKLSNYYEQVNVAVSIKNITGIRVYVVGEVKRPGTYNISSLSTAYNALFSAGGPTKRGSLRDVRVIRNGKAMADIDMYNFLLSGNRKQDINLISGDTVYVPVISSVAAVVGNVRRSGIYEILSKADLSDVINMAGGGFPTTSIKHGQI